MNRKSNQLNQADNGYKLLLSALVLLLAFLVLGCSGESRPTLIYDFPFPSDLRISGLINLSDVAVNRAFAGITPSLLDMSTFSLSVQDDPLKKTVAADYDGRFVLEPVSIRDQLVIFAVHSAHKGLILEYMAADSQGLWGEKKIEINLKSTARSLIARCLRDRYGRRINPDALEAVHIQTTVDAIANILEKRPQDISSQSIDQVAEVKSAYTAVAESLNAGGSGVWPNELTMLFYIGADNNLSAQLATTLEEIAQIELPSGTQILLQADFPVDGMKRFIKSGNKLVELGAIGKIDSASGAVIADFLAWSRRTFPARRFALFLSSHADGWRNSSQLKKSLISDDDAKTVGNPIEIAAWIQGANATFDGYYRPLELLVFDACSMGNIEVAYEFRNCAAFTIFSQALVPAAGMPLADIIDQIGSIGANNLDDKSLGRLICDRYKLKYLDAGVKLPVTVSMINNAGFPNFISKFQAYLEKIIHFQDKYLDVLANLRDSVEYEYEGAPAKFVIQAFERSENRDLSDMILKAREIMPDVKIETDQLRSVLPELIMVNYHSPWHFPGAGGLSIAFPDKNAFLTEYVGSSPSHYMLLQFCRETLWDELLVAINTPR